MDDGVRIGMKAALAELGPGDVVPAEAAEQLDWLDAGAELSMGLEPKGLSGPKGGRPKGSRNKRTTDVVDYILSRYRSPLIAAVEMYHRTPEQLAREWKLYRYHEGKPVLDANGEPALATGEAAKLIAAARDAALPYLHQKLPQAIEVSEKPRGHLTINLGSYGDVSDGIVLPISRDEQNRDEQNQQVSSEATAQSDNASVGQG